MRIICFLLLTIFVPMCYASDQGLMQQLDHWGAQNSSDQELADEIARRKKSGTDENFVLALEYFLASRKENSIERVELLIRLAEKNSGKKNFYSAFANYHLSCVLNAYKIFPFALEYSNRAIYYSKAIGEKRLLYYSYKNKAGIYFQMKEYQKACNAFLDAQKYNYVTDSKERASDYNNIALCHYELKHYEEALHNYSKGLNILKTMPGEIDENFYELILGNMGSTYVKMGEIEKGKKLLNDEAEYYRQKGFFSANYLSTTIQLLSLADRLNDDAELKKLSRELYDGLNDSKIAANSNSLTAIDTLLAIAVRKPIGVAEKSLSILRNQILIDHLTQKEKLHDDLTNFLYEEKIKAVVEKSINEKKEVTAIQQSEHSKFIAVLIICLAFLVIIIGGYLILRFRVEKNKRELIVQKQQEEMIKAHQQLLEKEMESQQQQLRTLVTNLKIKHQTETGFLEKVKQLKRNRNITTDQVIQELQIGLTNLFDIDKKMIIESPTPLDLDQDLSLKIKEKHPELTQTELLMCNYFASSLTAKEIGLLLKLSDISVRVAKNKIKNKIGLSKESNLNEYLQSLYN